MKKINLEQKILLRRCLFVFVAFIILSISSYYSFVVTILSYFIIQLSWSYFDSSTLKYNNTKFPLPDDILDSNIFLKIFCIIYYSIMLPMFFLGKLENKSLTISILIFASPVLLIFFHGLIIFYRRLGEEQIDIKEKPRKTFLNNKQSNEDKK